MPRGRPAGKIYIYIYSLVIPAVHTAEAYVAKSWRILKQTWKVVTNWKYDTRALPRSVLSPATNSTYYSTFEVPAVAVPTDSSLENNQSSYVPTFSFRTGRVVRATAWLIVSPWCSSLNPLIDEQIFQPFTLLISLLSRCFRLSSSATVYRPQVSGCIR